MRALMCLLKYVCSHKIFHSEVMVAAAAIFSGLLVPWWVGTGSTGRWGDLKPARG